MVGVLIPSCFSDEVSFEGGSGGRVERGQDVSRAMPSCPQCPSGCLEGNLLNSRGSGMGFHFCSSPLLASLLVTSLRIGLLLFPHLQQRAGVCAQPQATVSGCLLAHRHRRGSPHPTPCLNKHHGGPAPAGPCSRPHNWKDPQVGLASSNSRCEGLGEANSARSTSP